MNDNEEFLNKEPIKHILSELGKQTHMLPEMILAYARGILSQEGHSKVASHIKYCKQCAEALSLARKFLDAEQELDPEDLEAVSTVQSSPIIKAKLDLLALLNSKKEKLVKSMAKLLLPKESWFSIQPTIIIVKRRHGYSSPVAHEEKDVLPAAAFTPPAGLIDGRDYEVVIKVIDFIDLVCDLLLERCKTVADMKAELPTCVDHAITVLDSLKLDEESKSQILEVLSDNLITHED